ncbi:MULTISPECIES: cytochrome P450 [unclassified Streptomyces]|uniref:cytochrome P450 n=1 Tax=unclassified Streptomyces TaxID=2593676 RepID=UPI00225B61CE|nr:MULTISPECIES: cytochrome P450 [unclassified Streptomyces]MCX4868896.1 cytochrome P450 [Streptomyces sp. NBC_00906]MCX4900134.1 cytochrome P450 [Streptomyces sp. NBC_00892]
MTATGEGVRAYPFGPVERLEVDPKLAEICGEQSVLRVSLPYGGDAWLVTRHADVRTVLADPRFSRAAAVGEDIPRTVATGLPSTSMLSMDPPEHSRLRRRVANSFTVRRVEALRPRVQHIVNGLLDTMLAAGGPSDLTQTLTWPLPITVICELLGVPVADRDRFNVWVDGLLMLSDPVRSMEARGLLNDYLAGLVALRRITPTDDLLGELANVADEEDRLLDEELVSLGVSLLSAGQEATANQLGNFVYTLLTRPDLWQKLVADPALVPDAVEELSRIIPISASAGFTRIAIEDVELSGQTIRAGDAVVAELGIANRDPEVFDHPEEIDFHRGNVPHVTFGHGVHHCLGAQLARMELRVVLESLLRRLPGLHLAVPVEQISWRTNRLIRGVDALPVSW